ncbi:MAG TPA: hypothetical protein VGG39_14900 [Polyangiaceae bacterium]|jgi:hypothetical protein
MVIRKAKVRDESRAPALPPRKASYTRLTRIDRGSPGPGAPSTLPPPPFESEAAVPGLEWWLDAHMALVAEILWLEQLLDAVPEGSAHADTVRRITAHTDTVRDALYELYCDAADERLAPLVGPDGALVPQVRDSYAWCERVVGLLVAVTSALRAEPGPDWTAVKLGFRQAAKIYPSQRSALRQAVRELGVDYTSPVEPLRNLPGDIEQLLSSTEELHVMLQKRFA